MLGAEIDDEPADATGEPLLEEEEDDERGGGAVIACDGTSGRRDAACSTILGTKGSDFGSSDFGVHEDRVHMAVAAIMGVQYIPNKYIKSKESCRYYDC